MKNIIYVIALSLLFVSCSKEKNEESGDWTTPIKVASYNIQYDNTTQAPASVWANRKDLFKKIVEKHDFDIIGAQEPYLSQLNDILTLLPEYDYIGISIDGSSTVLKKHYTPIIYKRDKFEVLDWGTFWFSSSSSQPGSIGWDAQSPRICTRALMKDKATGKIFNFFNVHLDHIGTTARDMSVQMLLSLTSIANSKYPVIVTGDFNLNQNSVNYNKIKNSGILKDSYDLAEERLNSEYGTFNDYILNQNLETRIDHVFLSVGLPLKVKKHHIITDDFDGKYPSDHYPVMIDLSFKK